jgi:choline dehydrogenase-like flavoprotein
MEGRPRRAATGALPRAQGTIRPDPTRRYDVIIIGSGLGGSSLAHRLAKHGRKVLVVECGDFLRDDRADPDEPIGRYLYHVVKADQPPPDCVGGQSKFYGAALYRLRQNDFLEVKHETGVSPAWPIGYAELEPYYEQAERLYRVHGSSEGDLTDPRRGAPFAYPPLPHDPLVASVVERLQRSGATVAPIPRGVDYGTGGACVLCSTCDGHHCRLDAKMDAETAALIPAIETGNVDLATRTQCVRVLTDRDGVSAVGVVLRSDGREYELKAEMVVVAAGFTETAQLLRRSRTDAHPQGLGNATGVLGRYMGGHFAGYVFPLVTRAPIGPRHTKTFAITSFYHSAPGWPFPLGLIQLAGQMPVWERFPQIIRPLAHLVARHSLLCFLMTEALPTREAGLIFEGDQVVGRIEPPRNKKAFAKLRALSVDLFKRAGYQVLTRRLPPNLCHEVGIARMGADPATSVVDADCQVHGVSGLYVMGASVMPTAGAVNTALTIIALGLRAGDHIAAHSPDHSRDRPLGPRATA